MYWKQLSPFDCDAEEATVVAVETLRLAPNKRSFSDHQPSGCIFSASRIYVLFCLTLYFSVFVNFFRHCDLVTFEDIADVTSLGEQA
ncbi:hypothetical protein CFP56_041980 [Quercus suber]|uniref:Uncharacterized protein n=1 Tax=Quercus suber TaxID=58331 RepID=A0AAW0IUJ9_QUESU